MLGSSHVHVSTAKNLHKQCSICARHTSKKKIIATWFCLALLLHFRNSKVSQRDECAVGVLWHASLCGKFKQFHSAICMREDFQLARLLFMVRMATCRLFLLPPVLLLKASFARCIEAVLVHRFMMGTSCTLKHIMRL